MFVSKIMQHILLSMSSKVWTEEIVAGFYRYKAYRYVYDFI